MQNSAFTTLQLFWFFLCVSKWIYQRYGFGHDMKPCIVGVFLFGFLEFVLKLVWFRRFCLHVSYSMELNSNCCVYLWLCWCGSGCELACHVHEKQLLLGKEVMFASLTIYNVYSRKTSCLDNKREVVWNPMYRNKKVHIYLFRFCDSGLVEQTVFRCFAFLKN